MNNIMLVGRLTTDPEIRIAGSDRICVARGTIAVYRTKDKTDFIPFTAFRGTAELLEKYARKGMRVAITGSLHVDKYKKDGENRTSFGVAAVNVEFLESTKRKVDSNKSGNDFMDTDGEQEGLPFE